MSDTGYIIDPSRGYWSELDRWAGHYNLHITDPELSNFDLYWQGALLMQKERQKGRLSMYDQGIPMMINNKPNSKSKEECVEYGEDIIQPYGRLFASSYEKANIWPTSGQHDGRAILTEELAEVLEDAQKLNDYGFSIANDILSYPSEKELGNIKGHAVSTILECLQVISVCNKYAPVFAAAEKEHQEIQERNSKDYTTCPHCGHSHKVDASEKIKEAME